MNKWAINKPNETIHWRIRTNEGVTIAFGVVEGYQVMDSAVGDKLETYKAVDYDKFIAALDNAGDEEIRKRQGFYADEEEKEQHEREMSITEITDGIRQEIKDIIR